MSHAPEHPHAPHPKQPDIEDSPLGYHEALTEAVIALLREKGIFTTEEFRRTLEEIDSRSPADGARLVARAWVDPAFRDLALRHANAAALELGIDAGGIPIRAVADTENVHNVIVCTLCSCYPRLLLGASPDWYKSRAYAPASSASRAPCCASSAWSCRTARRWWFTTPPPSSAISSSRCVPLGRRARARSGLLGS